MGERFLGGVLSALGAAVGIILVIAYLMAQGREVGGPVAPARTLTYAAGSSATGIDACAHALTPACRCEMVARSEAGLLSDAAIHQTLVPDPESGPDSVALIAGVGHGGKVMRYRYSCTFPEPNFGGIPKATWRLLQPAQ